jgi:hypothetical protein
MGSLDWWSGFFGAMQNLVDFLSWISGSAG